MSPFRALLVIMLAVVLIYTALVAFDHGLNLVPEFFGAMAAMTWQGQFNIDFSMFLVLSALWTAWRGGFSGGSILLGAVAGFFGIVFLTSYLFYLHRREKGEMGAVLLGVHWKA